MCVRAHAFVHACVCETERERMGVTQYICLIFALFDFCTCTLTNTPASHRILCKVLRTF